MNPAIEKFAENVFLVAGPPIRAVGITFSTRMIVVKLLDGALWVNSPVSVPGDILDRIKTSGVVKYLVAPTKLHVWRLEEWHALFPDAELWAPPKMPKKFKSLPYTGILGDTPPPSWRADFDQLVFRGNCIIEEVLFLHKRSGCVIVGDLIQNHLPVEGRPLLNAMFKFAGVAYPNGGVAPDIKLSFIHRSLARESLKKLLSWDFDKLIIAHGVCIEKGAKHFVERAFRWLSDRTGNPTVGAADAQWN